MQPDEQTTRDEPTVRKMKRDKERDGKRRPHAKRRDQQRRAARAAKRSRRQKP